MKKEIFHIELGNGIYLISSTEFGIDTAMGKPTANSYLVIGENKAVLIDLAVDIPGIRLYAEELAQKPLQTVITHCHPDHIYRMSEFDEDFLQRSAERSKKALLAKMTQTSGAAALFGPIGVKTVCSFRQYSSFISAENRRSRYAFAY